MERISKLETATKKDVTSIESPELRESIERARDLRAKLEEFNGTDIVGRDALNEVELIASSLSVELQNISANICLKEGLPYHPTDRKTV